MWLVTGGGALFAAFPPVYAMTFSGFYLAIMLVLFGLILRAVSLEFRHRDPGWTRVWDGAFFLGSLVPSLLVRRRPRQRHPGRAAQRQRRLHGHLPRTAQPVLAARRRHRAVPHRERTASPGWRSRPTVRCTSAPARGARRSSWCSRGSPWPRRWPPSPPCRAPPTTCSAAGRLALHRGARRRARRTRSGSSARQDGHLHAFLGSAVIIVALAGIAAVGNYPDIVPARGTPPETSLTVTQRGVRQR